VAASGSRGKASLLRAHRRAVAAPRSILALRDTAAMSLFGLWQYREARYPTHLKTSSVSSCHPSLPACSAIVSSSCGGFGGNSGGCCFDLRGI